MNFFCFALLISGSISLTVAYRPRRPLDEEVDLQNGKLCMFSIKEYYAQT